MALHLLCRRRRRDAVAPFIHWGRKQLTECRRRENHAPPQVAMLPGRYTSSLNRRDEVNLIDQISILY
jgi:hypothetical protein